MKIINFRLPPRPAADTWVDRREWVDPAPLQPAPARAATEVSFGAHTPWHHLEAFARCGAVLASGLEDIAQEWLGFGWRRLRTNVGHLESLASCRTAQDVVAVQGRMVRDTLQDVLESGRRIAEVSTGAANRAAEAVAPGAKQN